MCCGLLLARQANDEFGESAEATVDLDRPATLLRDDVIGDRQAEPSFLAGRFGRDERLNQFVPDGAHAACRPHARALSANANLIKVEELDAAD